MDHLHPAPSRSLFLFRLNEDDDDLLLDSVVSPPLCEQPPRPPSPLAQVLNAQELLGLLPIPTKISSAVNQTLSPAPPLEPLASDFVLPTERDGSAFKTAFQNSPMPRQLSPIHQALLVAHVLNEQEFTGLLDTPTKVTSVVHQTLSPAHPLEQLLAPEFALFNQRADTPVEAIPRDAQTPRPLSTIHQMLPPPFSQGELPMPSLARHEQRTYTLSVMKQFSRSRSSLSTTQVLPPSPHPLLPPSLHEVQELPSEFAHFHQRSETLSSDVSTALSLASFQDAGLVIGEALYMEVLELMKEKTSPLTLNTFLKEKRSQFPDFPFIYLATKLILDEDCSTLPIDARITIAIQAILQIGQLDTQADLLHMILSQAAEEHSLIITRNLLLQLPRGAQYDPGYEAIAFEFLKNPVSFGPWLIKNITDLITSPSIRQGILAALASEEEKQEQS